MNPHRVQPHNHIRTITPAMGGATYPTDPRLAATVTSAVRPAFVKVQPAATQLVLTATGHNRAVPTGGRRYVR